MIQGSPTESFLPDEAYYRKLYRRHLQGAMVRTGASLLMWLFALLAYAIDLIRTINFIGVSLAVEGLASDLPADRVEAVCVDFTRGVLEQL